MLFREIIAVCSENHTKLIMLFGKMKLLNVKVGVGFIYSAYDNKVERNCDLPSAVRVCMTHGQAIRFKYRSIKIIPVL
jgi:hypothetical protein